MAKSKQRRKVQKSQQQAPQNSQWLWIAGAAAIAVIVVGVAFLLFGQDTTPATTVAANNLPAEISVDQAYQKYQEGAFVLDVRTPAEWNDFHAPDTTLIPLDELENRVDEVPRDREIVVVCRSGNRSQVGRDILRQAGFDQVASMSGGLRAWREAGYPVE